MAPTIDARIPLSLLEAIRRIDTPEDQLDAEYVPELRNKRLGLSDTVYSQIQRYSDAMKRGQQIPFAEAEGLGTLIGRRPDANVLFDSAGEILANELHESMPAMWRTVIHFLPGFVARPVALTQLRTAMGRHVAGTLERTGSYLSFKVRDSVTVNAAPDSAGCVFYESALGELLRVLVNGGGPIEHVKCAQRGDATCEWRAEWKTSHE